VLEDGQAVALRALELAAAHQLKARRIHDARHAAAALVAGVSSVFTYDTDDWEAFENDGMRIAGPASTLTRLGRPT
jgi:predicted nucleic acid-binding protein